MKKLSRVLILLSAIAIPICAYSQKKVQNVHSGQHQMPYLRKLVHTDRIINLIIYNHEKIVIIPTDPGRW
jgi:hypothetical protein